MQRVLDFLSGIACFIVLVILAFEIGLNSSSTMSQSINQWTVTYFGVDIALRVLFQKRKVRYFLLHPFDLALGITVLSWWGHGMFVVGSPFWLQVGLLLICVGRLPHLIGIFKSFPVNPSQTLVIGFLLSIFIGALFLSLPDSLQTGVELAFIDALFISTSAICVTGLATVNVAETFSLLGQVVLMVLIQLGGLGIMSFSVLLSVVLYKKITQSEGEALKGSFESKSSSESWSIIKAIFKYTLLFELIGAVVLFLFWMGDFETSVEALIFSLFHSISAFCNAGFSLFVNNCHNYATEPIILMTIASLVMLGGLGFPIMLNIVQHKLGAFRSKNLKLQTKLVLTVSAVLWTVGAGIIWLTEVDKAFLGMSWVDQASLSLFHSVSARTAGFSAIDISLFHPSTLLLIIVLMYIGVSPGSTGGGIKTTTFGILILTLWKNLTQKERVSVFGRTITNENCFKALSIVTLSGVLIFTGVFLLQLTDENTFLETLFEVISAFSTTGLSLGITEGLSNNGKKIIMVMMFLGRTGPLTVGFALARHRKQRNYSFPEERGYGDISMKTVAVIGLGQFGYQLSVTLSQKGFEVLSCDNRPEVVSEIKDRVSQAVIVDTTDESAMRAINVDTVDIVVIAMGTNVQASLLSTALCQRLDVSSIYVRAINSLQESILRSMGIENIINIERDMGIQLANTLSSDVGRYVEISNRHSMIEMRVPEKFVGETLKTLGTREEFGINVVGIKTRQPIVTDEGEIEYRFEMTDVPDPDYHLTQKDMLIIAGTDEKINSFIVAGSSDENQ